MSSILMHSIPVVAHTSCQPEISLKRLEDVLVDRLLLSLQTLFLGTVLAMTYSDGTIEFRDRTSIEPLPKDERTRQVSGLFQVGFDFLDVGACKFGPWTSIDHAKPNRYQAYIVPSRRTHVPWSPSVTRRM